MHTLGQENRPVPWPFSLGIVPNLSQWEVGDILVMHSTSPSNVVVQAQMNHPDPRVSAVAQWTHCAIYVGDGLILDARFLRTASVHRLSPDAEVRAIEVLRFDDAAVTADERRLFAEKALELEGVPYMYSPVGYALMQQGSYPNHGHPGLGLVCSSLVEKAALDAGIGIIHAPQVISPIVPGSLLLHPWLVRVHSEWRVAIG